MSQASFVQPPRIAVWLVDLFTPVKQAESIPGDLLEEFLDLTSKLGVARARRWYWRQSLKTIAHLIGSGFRFAPWRIGGAVLIGYHLGWGGYWLSEKAVVAVHYRYQVYAHIDAYVFWLIYGILIERLIEPMLIGCFVALMAKDREMVATVTLGLIVGASSGVGLVQVARHLPGTRFYLLPLLVSTFATPTMFVIGGGIVRTIRLAAARPFSRA